MLKLHVLVAIWTFPGDWINAELRQQRGWKQSAVDPFPGVLRQVVDLPEGDWKTRIAIELLGSYHRRVWDDLLRLLNAQ